MAYGLIHRLRVDSGIEAIVNVQANPGVTVTLIGSDKTTMFTAVADSTTGLAAITVNIPDTYTIGTDISADSFAEGNTTSIDISESKTYTAQFIKLNKGYTECGCTNAYKSNSLLVWWNGTKPTEYFSGWYCTDTDDNSEVTGEGTVYQISSSISYRGFLKDVASGTTKTYKVGSYITVNGTNYYSAADTVTGTAKTFATSTKAYTASTTVTVPDGCHSITIFVVGGGGGGGGSKTASRSHGNDYYYHLKGGCPGGGGGYTSTKEIPCTPGQSISVVIGGGGLDGYRWIKSGVVRNQAGGKGGTTSVSLNGITASAQGGNGGEGGGSLGWTDSYSDQYAGAGGSGTGKGGNGYYSRYTGKCEGGGAGVLYNNTRYGGGGMSGGGAFYDTKNSSTATMYTYTVANGGIPTGGAGGGGRGAYFTRPSNSDTRKTMVTSTSGGANTGGGGGGGSPYDSQRTPSSSGGSGVAIITFNT